MLLDQVMKGVGRNRRGVERIQTRRRPSLPIANDNVSNPPTDAELDTAFGVAADLPNGFVGFVDDNGVGSVVWLVGVVFGRWWYEQMTLAV